MRGYVRRFWQGSTDHRGVVGAPGRVVTLIPEPDGICHGVAYNLDPGHFRALDHREKGGYDRVEVTFEAERTVTAVTYIAARDNENYLGPAPVEAIADQIIRSVGPSGTNVEYLLRLEEALAQLKVEDEHVTSLARLVRARLPSVGGHDP